MSPAMDIKALQRRCEAQLRALALPPAFDLAALIERLGAARGRPIVLLPATARRAPCGVWLAARTRDYIFYESDTTPLHRAHIILHELAHLLLGHRSAEIADADLLRALVPHLDAHVLETVLRRAGYDTEHEQEAELLASLLLARLAPGEPRPPTVDGEAGAALERLVRSLESEAHRAA